MVRTIERIAGFEYRQWSRRSSLQNKFDPSGNVEILGPHVSLHTRNAVLGVEQEILSGTVRFARWGRGQNGQATSHQLVVVSQIAFLSRMGDKVLALAPRGAPSDDE
jgi:hypothetical protein